MVPESSVGKLVDAYASGSWMSASIGNCVDSKRSVGIFACTKDHAPWAVGPGHIGLYASSEVGAVTRIGLTALETITLDTSSESRVLTDSA